jgi:hypothetical protein
MIYDLNCIATEGSAQDLVLNTAQNALPKPMADENKHVMAQSRDTCTAVQSRYDQG